MEHLDELKNDKEVSLDTILTQEHKATKKLLEAQQVLQQVLQIDQRITTAWSLWGSVLELLGNAEKASEVMLTGLEWNKVNSFADYRCCSVLI